MKHLIRNTFWITFILLFSGCTDKQIRVWGRLENLPDGEMIFYTRARKTGKIINLDSCQIDNGQFTINFSADKNPETCRVFVNHKDPNTNILRVFSFKTNLSYRGASMGLDHFYLEDGIELNGKVSEETYPALRPKPGIKFVSIDRPAIVGRQTQVAYNDTISFGTLTDIAQIKRAVEQHPYSYYYLYELERRVSEFSTEGFLNVFRSFDTDVQQSHTGQRLLTYVTNRKSQLLTSTTRLERPSGQLQPILDKNVPYNLVVLWASWCGPCRQEIPALKELYARTKANQQLRMVSVSLDENRVAWIKALQKEDMPWPQLRVPTSTRQSVNELFQFDGRIPTMLLLDQQGKLVKKIVGYEADNVEIVARMIAQSSL